jgi:hypothetical protein
VSAVAASNGAGSFNKEIAMEVLKLIRRKFERVLGHGVFGRLRTDREPAAARLCKYGHAVFSGNNLCSYGHHAA